MDRVHPVEADLEDLCPCGPKRGEEARAPPGDLVPAFIVLPGGGARGGPCLGPPRAAGPSARSAYLDDLSTAAGRAGPGRGVIGVGPPSGIATGRWSEGSFTAYRVRPTRTGVPPRAEERSSMDTDTLIDPCTVLARAGRANPFIGARAAVGLKVGEGPGAAGPSRHPATLRPGAAA